MAQVICSQFLRKTEVANKKAKLINDIVLLKADAPRNQWSLCKNYQNKPRLSSNCQECDNASWY